MKHHICDIVMSHGGDGRSSCATGEACPEAAVDHHTHWSTAVLVAAVVVGGNKPVVAGTAGVAVVETVVVVVAAAGTAEGQSRVLVAAQ